MLESELMNPSPTSIDIPKNIDKDENNEEAMEKETLKVH